MAPPFTASILAVEVGRVKVKESESGCHLQIVAGVSVSFSNSSTAEEPIGLKCILEKICFSFIFNNFLAETNNLAALYKHDSET